ncbi:MAG: DUF4388 domain-containing protein [Candidatus Obscuribacterales bacterium]|nr:DUF4388 domain-containing protein [Cyanobacteria bacterium SZAS LIN-5]RTL35683.1 MAG: DUF4388 domain-containing protein [Candidatus Melainabacteria bacterium]
MAVEQNEIITERLSRMMSQENVVVLKYGPDLLAELNGLSAGKHLFDAVLIDATTCGYLFPAELLIEAGGLAGTLLEVQGALVFVKKDKAVAVVRDTLMGSLSFHIFENHAELFDYSAPLARHVQSVIGSSGEVAEESTDLAQQVLMSTVPVLTHLGIKMKAGMDQPRRRNAVIAAVDNFTPLSTITHRITSQGRMTADDVLEELKGLEQSRAIYPIFNKVPFLVNCFRNQTPFTLKDLLLASKLVTQDQVDELLFELHSMPIKERVTLGPLAVKKGFINTRQLEIALQDQAFYGQTSDSDKVKLVKTSGEETQVQSLVGHLGTTDPSNLLQNIATNRESGVLSVEYKDSQFRAQFEVGRLTHAKVGKVAGNSAVIEFASSWKDGIFVFIQRTPPADLARDNCKVSKPLDKLLLDAALAKDNTDTVLKKLPKGINSVLEKVPDDNGLLETLLEDPQEKRPVSAEEMERAQRVWAAMDGITSLATSIRYLGDVTTSQLTTAINLLLHHELVKIPKVDLHGPLDKFQQLVGGVSAKITAERSLAFLRLALRDSIGYSGRARIFTMGAGGEVGVDLAAARSAQTSLTTIIKDIENWQVKYIEYVSQELNRDVLLGLIREIHQAS